ncbi:MAG: S53 family peptidase [Dokdonella sp.]
MILNRILAIGFAGLAVSSSAAFAAPSNLVVASVNSAQRATLPAARATWAQERNDLGKVPDDLALDDLSVMLRRSPERQQAYNRLLQEQQDPSSPNYHHWLSPSEIGEQFGATQHDLDVLSNWLGTQGLKVNAIANNRVQIHFSGRAADVARTFATGLHYYQAGSEKRMANTHAASIPLAFSAAVKSIVGLAPIKLHPVHEFSTPRSMPARDGIRPASTNCQNGVCSYSIFPGDFSTIYNVKPVYQQGIDGSGQSIAIISRQRVSEPDVMNFQKLVGLPTKYPVVIIPPAGTDPGTPATTCNADTTVTPNCDKPGDAVSDQGEATLDVQRAGSVAPGATIKLIVSSKNVNDGLYIAMEYAIDTNPPPAQILSISYGTCEADNSQDGADYIDHYFSQAAMEGISVFVSSGDGGVAGCASLDSAPTTGEAISTNLLCASSHATCVGGTEFADSVNPGLYWNSHNGANYASALGYIPEGAWNQPLNAKGNTQAAATGGGASIFMPVPSWQNGLASTNAVGRYTPDVSFAASTREGYFTCVAAQGGSCTISNNSFHFLQSGGTSASAPSMAGIAALLNQKTGSAQANLNPRLYALAANPGNGVFHDVTVASSGVSSCVVATPSLCNNSTPGPNDLTGGLSGYAVASGYDLATGLGSIDVANLLAQWGNPTASAVNLNQHGLTGTWYNPATNGQGLVMEVDADFYSAGTGLLFAGWYTNDVTIAGGQRWYTLQAQVVAGNPSVSAGIYLTEGGTFSSAAALATTSEVGRATLQFSDCSHGALQYTFSDGSGRNGTIPLTRLNANISCGQSGGNGAASSSFLLSGAWYDAPGQGIVFDVNPTQNVLFAGWYTYAANAGTNSGPAGQHWYTLQATLVPGTSVLNSIGLYDTTGGAFNQAKPITTTQVGTASMVYNSCTSATLTYSFTAGANAGAYGTMHLVRLGATPAGCHL